MRIYFPSGELVDSLSERLLFEEYYYLLGYNAVHLVESQRRFGGTYRLHLQGRIIPA
jgi:hypothetical protein